MKTYTTEELRESMLAMSVYMAEEVPQDTLKDDTDDSTGAWWLVASEFVEWCVKHKGGVLLFEFLADAGRADSEEMERFLKAILGNKEGGE
jgi:hypothetical protein